MGKIYTRLLAAAAICSTAMGASAQAPVDMTSKIRESQFIGGWMGTNFGWNANDGVAEYFQQISAEKYQILKNMPAGIYTLQFNGFVRNAGNHSSADDNDDYNVFFYIKPGITLEWRNDIDPTTEDALDLYTYGIKIKSLYSDDSYSYNPYTFPNNMAQAAAAFNEGKYLNEGTLTLTEPSDMRFGVIRPLKWRSNGEWACVDNFRLYYQELEGSAKIDMTDRLGDPDFATDPNVGAWSSYPGTIAYNTAIEAGAHEWYRAPIDMQQTISGLEAGRYKITCQAFKRDFDEVTMFANEVTTPIADFWSVNAEGLSTKQSIVGAGELFDLGYYINKAIVELKDGDDLTIGLKKDGTSRTDWVAARGFGLFYLPVLDAPLYEITTMNGGPVEEVSGEVKNDFVSNGHVFVKFSSKGGQQVYCKFETATASTDYVLAGEDGYEVPGEGILSYYATNDEDQQSEIYTLTFINEINADGKPVNMSYVIKNQEFTRWEGNARATAVQDNFFEKFNWGADEFYQTLYHMPAGIYTVECQGFYRNGGKNVDVFKNNVPFVYLLINDTEVAFNSLYDETDAYEAVLNDEGTNFTSYTFPDNVAQAKAAFEKGLYKVSASATVGAEGIVKIGQIRYNDEQHPIVGANWHASTGFRLYYQTQDGATKIDITDKLSNPDFKMRDGVWFNKNEWDGDNAVTVDHAYKAKERYQGAYTFTQSIAGLPAGRYRLQLQGFMSGNQTPWNDVDPEIEEVTATWDPACYLMANNEKQALMPFIGNSDNANANADGLNALQTAGLTFDDNMYNDNRVFVEIEDGEDIVIGLSKQVSRSRDWVVFRDFSLYYLPAIDAPDHNLGIADGTFEHDFEAEGAKTVTFSHASDDVTIYYKWEPVAADAQLISVKEGYAEVPADGLTISTPGTLSYYAENSEGQQSPVQAVTLAAKDTSTGSISLVVDDVNAPAEYYNLQGIRINTPAAGDIVIEKRGHIVKKIVIRK